MAGDGGADEPATGATLYLETILRALPGAQARELVFLPHDTAADVGRKLRETGWTTLAGLEEGVDAEREAIRLGCTHILAGGKPIPISKKGS